MQNMVRLRGGVSQSREAVTTVSDKRCEKCEHWVKTNWHGTEGKCRMKNTQTKWDQTCSKFLPK